MTTIKSISLSLLLALSLTGASYAQDLEFYSRVEAYSEPVSIDAFTSGWHDDLQKGDDAALHARIGQRFQQGRLLLGWSWRYDYQLRFAPGTAELYHHVRNHLPVTPERPYPLAVEAYHVERHGPQFGYRWVDDKTFQLSTTLSLYQGQELLDGRVDGHARFQSARPDGDQLKDLFATIDYRYSEPELHEEELDWNPKAPRGLGYGLDIDLRWQPRPDTVLRLQIDDAIGRLYWRDVPQTAAQLRCDCTLPDYDLNGDLSLRRHYRQRLRSFSELNLDQALTTDWQARLRVLHDEWLTPVQLGLGRQWRGHQIGGWYEPGSRAWRLSVDARHWTAAWTADRWDTGKAHRLGLNLGGHWDW